MVQVLLAGESSMSINIEVVGKNTLIDSTYNERADHLKAILEEAGANVNFQPAHIAGEKFPKTMEELNTYDIIVFSDIGADTLQLTQEVSAGERDTDRCALIRDWVLDGGSFGMIGGYLSFAGKGGKARYGMTPLTDVLPVEIARTDDRVETPGGAVPINTGAPPDDLPEEWPAVLGYNRFVADKDADVWATIDTDPFLVVNDAGSGATFAFATDCAPHWAPPTFLEWEGLPVLFKSIIDRLSDN